MYLPEGPLRPLQSSLDAFWHEAQASLPHGTLPDSYEVRCIGVTPEGAHQVFDLIQARDKTGTFTLRWIVEKTDMSVPAVGQCLMLIDFEGKPALLVRTDEVREACWGAVTEQDTAVDGTPVRALDVWIPLHSAYWNGMLEPFGLAVKDGMPFYIEHFTPIFSRWPRP